LVAYAFRSVPEQGEPCISVIEAPDLAAAKTMAVDAIKQSELSAIRLWDGERVFEFKRPVAPVAWVAPRNERSHNAAVRGAQMMAMKAEGKSFREIGAAYGISPARARDVVTWAQNRDARPRMAPNRAALSTRARNLVQSLIDEPESDEMERDRLLPKRVASLTRKRLFAECNAGSRTVAEPGCGSAASRSAGKCEALSQAQMTAIATDP